MIIQIYSTYSARVIKGSPCYQKHARQARTGLSLDQPVLCQIPSPAPRHCSRINQPGCAERVAGWMEFNHQAPWLEDWLTRHISISVFEQLRLWLKPILTFFGYGNHYGIMKSFLVCNLCTVCVCVFVNALMCAHVNAWYCLCFNIFELYLWYHNLPIDIYYMNRFFINITLHTYETCECSMVCGWIFPCLLKLLQR